MLRLVPDSATITLTYSGPSGFEEPFPSLHHAFITTLRICGSPEAARRIKDLSMPTTVDGLQTWSLPRLTDLIFSHCNLDSDDLIKMVRNRYGKDSRTEEEGGSVDKDVTEGDGSASTHVTKLEEEHITKTKYVDDRHPKPLQPPTLDRLEILVCSGVTADENPELEEIIGFDKVIWKSPEDDEEVVAGTEVDSSSDDDL
ncbi:hypothetical protein FRB98_001878 [Tulasnella sp. 332]|nr:hypothetical protein FRB98_001878 [Tulasnella sp. 332]